MTTTYAPFTIATALKSNGRSCLRKDVPLAQYTGGIHMYSMHVALDVSSEVATEIFKIMFPNIEHP